MSTAEKINLFSQHSRHWRSNLYVYPVISRRSKGLSIGINLNPDKACNFDCIYCQVDRSTPPRVRQVDLEILQAELDDMFKMATDGSLFRDTHFGHVPAGLRRLNDIAFSGDGEPTTCPQFLDAVRLVAEIKDKYDSQEAKIVLITDAGYLSKPKVIEALAVMDRHQGEIWAKLDAGTQQYYELVNRPNFPLAHILENILAAATVRPIVIQSLFMRIHDAPPAPAEIDAFCQRLSDITANGGRIKLVQVYTIARRPTENYVTALSNQELDLICEAIGKQTELPTEPYYSQ